MPTRSQRHLTEIQGTDSAGYNVDFTPGTLTSFTVAGNLPGRANLSIGAGPDCQVAAVYRVPNGAPLNKAVHTRFTVGVSPGAITQYVDGAAGTVSALPNSDFTAAAPPPSAASRGWSVGGGKLAYLPKPNNVFTSPDGVSWASQSGIAGSQWQSVAWSPTLNLFCAVAQGGGDATSRVMTSPDGITWTPRTTPELIGTSCICWGGSPGQFVAFGVSGVTTRAMRSPDGINWTLISPTGISTRSWRDVCWSSTLGLFLAIMLNGSTQTVITSPDAITWTLRNTPGTLGGWYGAIWAPAPISKFIVVGTLNDGQRVMTSDNGIDWTLRDTPLDANWRSVAYSPSLNLLCAVHSSSNIMKAMTSPDGINWTGRNLPDATSAAWMHIEWAASLGKFVAIGFGTPASLPRIMTSPDGINWTYQKHATPAASALDALAWSPALGKFVAISSDDPTFEETVVWDQAAATGETWRAGVTVDAVSVGAGNISFAYMADGVSANSWSPAFSTTGLKYAKAVTIANRSQMGLTLNAGVNSATLDNIAFFKETPDMVPQGVWDYYAFPATSMGFEGTGATPVTGVVVV